MFHWPIPMYSTGHFLSLNIEGATEKTYKFYTTISKQRARQAPITCQCISNALDYLHIQNINTKCLQFWLNV
jgi:hypothetical protein